jgi:hypothetical protein
VISSAPIKDPRAVRVVPRARFQGGRRPFMLCAVVQALPSLASHAASSRVTAPSERVGLRERPCAHWTQERQQGDLPRLATPTPGITARYRLKSPNLSEAPRRILALRPRSRARGSGQGPRLQLSSEQVSGAGYNQRLGPPPPNRRHQYWTASSSASLASQAQPARTDRHHSRRSRSLSSITD